MFSGTRACRKPSHVTTLQSRFCGDRQDSVYTFQLKGALLMSFFLSAKDIKRSLIVGWLCLTLLPTIAIAAPIVTVQRDIYLQQTVPGVAPGSQMFLAGPMDGANTHRMEYLYSTAASDIGSDVTIRFSSDNGRTWTTPILDVPSGVNISPPSGGGPDSILLTESTGNAMPTFDPTSGLLITPWYRSFSYRSASSSVTHHYIHSYYRTSADHGVSWSVPVPLDYESGSAYTGTLIMNDTNLSNGVSVGNLFSSSYYSNNNSYPSQKFVLNANGQLAIGMGMLSS